MADVKEFLSTLSENEISITGFAFTPKTVFKELNVCELIVCLWIWKVVVGGGGGGGAGVAGFFLQAKKP